MKPSKAIDIANQLITYDGLKEIVKIQKGQISDFRLLVIQKDTMIASYQRSDMKNSAIIVNKDVIIQAKDQELKTLNKKYLRSVRWGRFKVVLLPVAAVAGLYAGAKLFN